MSTLFFKVFFDGIPLEIEESAASAGAGPVRILWQIVRPLARPVIGAMSAYTLINSWNEYLLATTLISDSSKRTFPAALQQYMSSFNFTATTIPGQQAVYLLIPIAAAVVLLLLTQRQLASAYEGGAVKG
jgi:multiple sugar transport system permease protein